MKNNLYLKIRDIEGAELYKDWFMYAALTKDFCRLITFSFMTMTASCLTNKILRYC